MPRAFHRPPSPLLALIAALAACRAPLPPDDLPRRDAAPDARFDAATPDAPPDAPPPAARLRVATFNVHRYFDTECQSARCGLATSYEALPSPGEFAAQTDRLARAITTLDADVVLLQEVETQACLDALQARLGPARYAVAVLGEIGVPASVDVAVLARGTWLATRTHRETPLRRPDGSTTYFSRELLEVHLAFGARRVAVFAAHFRSMVDDDPGRRLAEAAAARAIVTATAAEFADALVVFGGDLNDTPGSPTLALLEQDGALVRVARELAPRAAATYRYNGTWLALDHLYVPAAVAPRYVPGTVTAVRDPGEVGLGDSDHAALRADFALE